MLRLWVRLKAGVHWKGGSSASHPRGPRSRHLALAFSYEAVASVREELVQEIALAIWQALPRFRGECSERTFVFRIAHNRGLIFAVPGYRLYRRCATLRIDDGSVRLGSVATLPRSCSR